MSSACGTATPPPNRKPLPAIPWAAMAGSAIPIAAGWPSPSRPRSKTLSHHLDNNNHSGEMPVRHSRSTLVLGLAFVGCSLSVNAAVTAQEAAALGNELTLFGAIKAGNADGSIPAYDGGLRKAPAGFTADSGFWIDPFKDEKP